MAAATIAGADAGAHEAAEGEDPAEVSDIFEPVFEPVQETADKEYKQMSDDEVFQTVLRIDAPELNFVTVDHRHRVKKPRSLEGEVSKFLKSLYMAPSTELGPDISKFFADFFEKEERRQLVGGVRSFWDRQNAALAIWDRARWPHFAVVRRGSAASEIRPWL